MNISDNSEVDHTASARCGMATSMLLICIVVTFMTFISWSIYPHATDDSLFELSIRNNVNMRAFSGDRPILGEVYQFLAEHRLHRLIGAIVHWINWTGMGLVTMLFWRKLFPSHSAWALPVACLAIAPILDRAQLFAVVFPLGTIVPVIVYAAMFGLLSWPTAARWARLRAVVFLAMAVLPVMINEYALPVIIIAAILLWLRGLQTSDLSRRRYHWTAVALLVLAAATYLVYWKIANPTARTSVRPEMALSHLGTRLETAPRKLVSAVWEGAGGAFLEKLSEWNLHTKEAVAGTLAGIVLACCVFRMVGRQNQSPQSDSGQGSPSWPSILLLLAFIALGRTPVAWLDVGAPSRYWCPLIPIAASVTIAILLRVLNPRVHWIIAPTCGFLLGYTLVYDASVAMNKVHRCAQMGIDLENQIPGDGLTLIVPFVDSEQPALNEVNDLELTAHVTENWAQKKRSNCWVFASAEQAQSACTSPHGLFDVAPTCAHMTRGVGVQGPVSHILWLQLSPGEPWKIVHRGPPKTANSLNSSAEH